MKIKIMKCSRDSWWYLDKVGQTMDVIKTRTMSDGLNYEVEEGMYVLVADAEVVDEFKIVTHEGVQYKVHNWVTHIARNSAEDNVTGFEFEPKWSDRGHWTNDVLYSGRIQYSVKPYVAPKPEGNFLVKV